MATRSAASGDQLAGRALLSSPSDFSYRATKDGSVFISWRGEVVVTLKGAKASRFLTQADGASEDGAQMLMARATGNFKRGNERR